MSSKLWPLSLQYSFTYRVSYKNKYDTVVCGSMLTNCFVGHILNPPIEFINSIPFGQLSVYFPTGFFKALQSKSELKKDHIHLHLMDEH